MATLPDVRVIDEAILAVLTDDAILMALMPGGVHWAIAPPGLARFVIVDGAQDFEPSYVFGATDGGIERIGYLVKAIARASETDAPLDAAARIHDLLHMQPLVLTGTGYEWMATTRTRRVRYPERDPHNVEWQHIGAVYDVMVSSEFTTAS